MATGRERALTTGGGPQLLNGRLDWVYQEEIYGRGDYKAYWWSPDSRRIAFLRLDEAGVPVATVVDHVPVHQELEVTPYPQPGDPNPKVAVGVVPVVGGEAAWVDLARYQPSDPLVVGVGWTPDSARVVVQVQDREQTWLDFDLADPDGGAVETLFRDRSAAFIESGEQPTYLADGSLPLADHAQRLEAPLPLRRRRPAARRADAGRLGDRRPAGGRRGARRVVYVTSNRDRAPDRQLYRVGLDGTGLDPDLAAAGHPQGPLQPRPRASTSTPGRRLDAAAGAPPRRRRRARCGSSTRTGWRRSTSTGFGAVDFFQVPARDGFAMEAMSIKPADFDPAKRYPVLIYQYGGPHAPAVREPLGARTACRGTTSSPSSAT